MKLNDRLVRDEADAKDAGVADLLIYMDFGDAYALLNQTRSELPEDLGKYFRSITEQLQELVPIRNRIAHGRPLDYADFPTVIDTAKKFSTTDIIVWQNLRQSLDRLRLEPSFVLDLDIPTNQAGVKVAEHNLPLPEYDETGFVGRKEQVKDLVSRLKRGVFPVVTIVAEGGIGKTAMALKAAYDLLGDESNPFEATVWTTSKTQRLSPTEIISIEDAICDSLQLFRHVADHLGVPEASESIEEILEYMRSFRILLIIDNLETVLDENIKSFVGRLPTGSKILITSRIGLGAYEDPVKLQPLTGVDAVALLKATAKLKGAAKLVRLQPDEALRFCERMHFNPLFIKWFVSAVTAGGGGMKRRWVIQACSWTIACRTSTNSCLSIAAPSSRQ